MLDRLLLNSLLFNGEKNIEFEFLFKILSPRIVKKYLVSVFVSKIRGVKKLITFWIVIDSGIVLNKFLSVFIFLTSYNPDFRIRLLIFDVKIIYIAAVLLIIDVIQIPSGNSGGHLAHLGGAFIGFYYQNKISKGEDFAKWILIFYNFIFKGFNKNKKKNYKAYRKKTNFNSINQKEIDTILDKISKSGYDSLSKKEKETLFKAGK